MTDSRISRMAWLGQRAFLAHTMSAPGGRRHTSAIGRNAERVYGIVSPEPRKGKAGRTAAPAGAVAERHRRPPPPRICSAA
jgi:hypothetical protein